MSKLANVIFGFVKIMEKILKLDFSNCMDKMQTGFEVRLILTYVFLHAVTLVLIVKPVPIQNTSNARSPGCVCTQT